MYRFDLEKQTSFEDFNQPLGLEMDPNNRWVKKAGMIPWESIEVKYAENFSDLTGAPAKPLRTALGSLLIQKQYTFSDAELVEQLKENPYYQYFIGLPGYTNKAPFAASLLVEFRKRLSENVMMEINEMIIEFNQQKDNADEDDHNGDDNHSDSGEHEEEHKSEEKCSDKSDNTSQNEGTLILDATCAPQNIKFPQDVELLNEAREKLEKMICEICSDCHFKRPRMYREIARKDYLAFAKRRKKGAKNARKAIKKQLGYVRRDLGYIEEFLKQKEDALSEKNRELLTVLLKVYEQQKYMYDNKIHTVKNRIVSISQPYIRPIVRGKAKSPVEFGAKLDLSVDENGMSRIEKLSFDAYNEESVLKTAVENYKKRTGHYPERVLADQIYRNRENISYCNSLGIRLSGKRLGRLKKDTNTNADKKLAYQDNTDRIEVERKFSLAKHKFGLGLLVTKLEETTKSSIVLSVIAMNIDRLWAMLLRIFRFLALIRSSYSVSVMTCEKGWLFE